MDKINFYGLITLLMCVCEGTASSCDEHSIVKQFETRVSVLEDIVLEQQNSNAQHNLIISQQQRELDLLKSKTTKAFQRIINVKNHHNVVGCITDSLSLTCPDDRLIYVTYAEYGQYFYPCTDACCIPNPAYDCVEDVLENAPEDWAILKYRCDNKTTCTYEYKGVAIPDCEVEYLADYMQIYYDCIPEPATITVGFTAWASATVEYSSDELVMFDSVGSNFGSHYNPDTGTFTCPYHATYMFSLIILSEIDHRMECKLMFEDSLLASAYADNVSNAHNQANALVITECFPGQVIWVRSTLTGTLNGNGNRHSQFSGYLLQRLY